VVAPIGAGNGAAHESAAVAPGNQVAGAEA
jgi:hypothetical protein